MYIGKAKNLNNRIKFYTQPKRLNSRLSYMVSNTVKLEIIVTSSEIEALLLESNLIKKFEPIFNILLKDDKSFSSILFNLSHSFPQLSAHRVKEILRAIILDLLSQKNCSKNNRNTTENFSFKNLQ